MTGLARPGSTAGLRHVALYCADLEACRQFYVDLLGMRIEWQPDNDNIYLTSGNDNLALHRAGPDHDMSGAQHLDHIGFVIREPDQVDDWYRFFVDQGVRIRKELRTHRDGARSFYCYDPDGNIVQLIYHPPIADK